MFIELAGQVVPTPREKQSVLLRQRTRGRFAYSSERLKRVFTAKKSWALRPPKHLPPVSHPFHVVVKARVVHPFVLKSRKVEATSAEVIYAVVLGREGLPVDKSFSNPYFRRVFLFKFVDKRHTLRDFELVCLTGPMRKMLS